MACSNGLCGDGGWAWWGRVERVLIGPLPQPRWSQGRFHVCVYVCIYMYVKKEVSKGSCGWRPFSALVWPGFKNILGCVWKSSHVGSPQSKVSCCRGPGLCWRPGSPGSLLAPPGRWERAVTDSGWPPSSNPGTEPRGSSKSASPAGSGCWPPQWRSS